MRKLQRVGLGLLLFWSSLLLAGDGYLVTSGPVPLRFRPLPDPDVTPFAIPPIPPSKPEESTGTEEAQANERPPASGNAVTPETPSTAAPAAVAASLDSATQPNPAPAPTPVAGFNAANQSSTTDSSSAPAALSEPVQPLTGLNTTVTPQSLLPFFFQAGPHAGRRGPVVGVPMGFVPPQNVQPPPSRATYTRTP